MTGVLVLQLHFQAERGVPVPGYLHRAASWMAALSFSRYVRPGEKMQVSKVSPGLIYKLFVCQESGSLDKWFLKKEAEVYLLVLNLTFKN